MQLNFESGIARQIGQRVLANKGVAIIGMSLGNSYFCETNVDHLLRQSLGKFSRLIIFITEGPSVHNYIAEGYSQKRALGLAHSHGNALRNRVSRVLNQIGIDALQRTTILDWTTTTGTSEYRTALREFEELYRSNLPFQQAVLQTTRTILCSRISRFEYLSKDSQAKKIESAKSFLLEELAGIDATAKLSEMPEIAYVYHRRWPIYQDLVAGKFDGRIRTHLGLVLCA